MRSPHRRQAFSARDGGKPLCAAGTFVAFVYGLRRGTYAGAVPLLLLVAVLLVAALASNLAHLDTAGEALPTLPSAGASEATPLGLMATLPLLAFALAVAGLFLFFGGPEGPHWPRRGGTTSAFSFRGLPLRFLALPAAIVAALFLMRAIAFVLEIFWPGFIGPDGGPKVPSGDVPVADVPLGGPLGVVSLVARLVIGLSTGAGLPVATEEVPLGLLVVVGLLGVLLAFGFAYEGHLDRESERAAEAARSGKGTPGKESAGLAAASIAGGADARSTVLRCFRDFCGLLGRRGLLDQEVLTPWELERLAVSQLRVSPSAAEAVTALFEVARYSTRPLDEADGVRAVVGLEEIRVSLQL